MMKKILAIVGSNSKQSINKQLTEYASKKLAARSVDIVELNEFEAPIYSIDIEKEDGFLEAIKRLFELIQTYDAFIIASPEHNGLMPAVLKNTIDWLTRVKGKFIGGKPVLLLSTSPGVTGGANNLSVMSKLLPWWGGNLVDTYSLGSFGKNFDSKSNRISNKEEELKLIGAIDKLKAA